MYIPWKFISDHQHQTIYRMTNSKRFRLKQWRVCSMQITHHHLNVLVQKRNGLENMFL